ncbi:MAG: hypothetical protein GX280_00300 [Lentisphaerae bacterium]|nr:hypothetical protein [Lentisphaerota bacterium]
MNHQPHKPKLTTVAFCGAAIVLMLFLCSCASSRRMLRFTPFHSDSDQPTTSEKQNYSISCQFNLWPLYCHAENAVSMLWPLFDYDENGYALRPFINKEYQEYSLLFPLAAWNPTAGDGWFFNVYWNNTSSYAGCFPLFHFSPNMNSILNIYWSRRDTGEADDYGFFPFFHHEYGIRQWVFPLYMHQTIDGENTLLTPLFGYSEHDEKLTMFNLLIGCYFYLDRGNSQLHSWLWPLTVYEKSPEQNRFHLIPLYSHNSEWPALVNWSENQKYANGIKNNFNVLGPLCFMRTSRYNDIFSYDSHWAGSHAPLNETDNILLGLIGWGHENYIAWDSDEAEELAWSLYFSEVRKYAKDDARQDEVYELQQELEEQLKRKITATMNKFGIAERFPETRAEFTELRNVILEKHSREYLVEYGHFLPFFRYNQSEDGLNWDLLWLLVEYTSNRKENQRQFSFLWRVFNYETRAGKSSGHILFIPW